MEELTDAFNSLDINLCEIIKNDVEYILYCADHQILCLDTSMFKIKKNMVKDTAELYSHVIKTLSKYDLIQDLLEIMPYIDDYIEYYASL